MSGWKQLRLIFNTVKHEKHFSWKLFRDEFWILLSVGGIKENHFFIVIDIQTIFDWERCYWKSTSKYHSHFFHYEVLSWFVFLISSIEWVNKSIWYNLLFLEKYPYGKIGIDLFSSYFVPKASFKLFSLLTSFNCREPLMFVRKNEQTNTYTLHKWKCTLGRNVHKTNSL